MELELFYKLNEAYETTTRNFNRFKNVIESIKWEETFKADGETYFLLGKLTLTIENINPFKEAWKPTVMINDGSGFFRELGVC